MKPSTFNQLQVFHTIVHQGSITGAARALQIATPSVSHSLKQLEQNIGLPLFTRTTRKIELTDAGQLLHQTTLSSLQHLDLALESVSDMAETPRGKVRMTVPRFFYQRYLKPIYAKFCKMYPEISLEISVDDGTVDIVEQGFDIGIRFGDRISDQMVVKPLTPPRKDALFVSPEYAKKLGIPSKINELKHHKLIYYRFITSNKLLPLVLYDNQKEVLVDMEPALIANDTDIMKDAALQGLGIGRLLEPFVATEFQSGQLIPVLSKHWQTVAGVYVYFHQHSQKAKRVRVLIDFLETSCREMVTQENQYNLYA